MVSISLRCPQGTVLPTLPPRVLQGAAVSGERISQGPPGNVVALGCPPPPRRVSERSVQMLPFGSPFQDVVLTAQLDRDRVWLIVLPHLHKSPSGFAVTSTLQTGVPNPPVDPREVVVSSSSLHPGGPQYRSRHPVETGAEAREMEAPPRGGGADLEGVRPGTSGSVCVSRDVLLSTLVLAHRHGMSDGADMAEASSVCISPDRSAPGSPGESSPAPGSTTSHCPRMAGQSMVPRYNIPSRWASSGAPRQEGHSVPSRGLDISPPTRTVETVGLTSEGTQLVDSGLSTEIVENILHSRAPSTRKLYALKWKVFTSWCRDHQLDPVDCPVGTVLEFLQDRFTAGLAPSTLKVYVVAISA